jgi:hypothetical protein
MVHPKLLKYRDTDLTKIQDLSTVDQDIADAERDLDILKQRLSPKLRANFDNISVDKKELDALKQRVQAEKQRRAQPQQPKTTTPTK